MSPPYAESSASGGSGGILEQAWMLKMAQEIARKVAEEKGRASSPHGEGEASKGAGGPMAGLWAGEEEIDAPPAYQA